ncbi:hypothetical protein INO08_16155, partial [Staphylococcus aureus]|nr:hypothetical protein [Staphylococcus aureus]
VQNQLVSGLKYSHVVTRRGIKVDSAQEMLGSYGPDPQKVRRARETPVSMCSPSE